MKGSIRCANTRGLVEKGKLVSAGRRLRNNPVKRNEELAGLCEIAERLICSRAAFQARPDAGNETTSKGDWMGYAPSDFSYLAGTIPSTMASGSSGRGIPRKSAKLDPSKSFRGTTRISLSSLSLRGLDSFDSRLICKSELDS